MLPASTHRGCWAPPRPAWPIATPNGIAGLDSAPSRTRAVRLPRGHAEFWSLDPVVRPAVLDPASGQRDADRRRRSGAFPIRRSHCACWISALAPAACCWRCWRSFPTLGVGTDASAEALAVAQLNAEGLGLHGRARLGAYFLGRGNRRPLRHRAQQPALRAKRGYRRSGAEVGRFEPRAALDGGLDGLSAYRSFCRKIPRLLALAGELYLRSAKGRSAVGALASASGLAVAMHRDLAGIIRCLELTAKLIKIRRRRASPSPQ